MKRVVKARQTALSAANRTEKARIPELEALNGPDCLLAGSLDATIGELSGWDDEQHAPPARNMAPKSAAAGSGLVPEDAAGPATAEVVPAGGNDIPELDIAIAGVESPTTGVMPQT